jgi:hypothetical protein
MIDDFLFFETEPPAKLCPAKIIINGGTYPCMCDKGHEGPHITGAKLSEIVFDGFEWTTEGGRVNLTMPPHVAAVVYGLAGVGAD